MHTLSSLISLMEVIVNVCIIVLSEVCCFDDQVHDAKFCVIVLKCFFFNVNITKCTLYLYQLIILVVRVKKQNKNTTGNYLSV